VHEAREFITQETTLERIIFVCFDQPTLRLYQRALGIA